MIQDDDIRSGAEEYIIYGGKRLGEIKETKTRLRDNMRSTRGKQQQRRRQMRGRCWGRLDQGRC